MKKIQTLFTLIIVAILTACGHGKKIIVYANTDSFSVDESQKNITFTDGTTHQEKELEFGGSPVTLTIQSPSGKYTVDAADDGLYILNLQKDTLVGSFQHIGADNGKVIYTPELIKHTVDSLNQLITGTNISAANKNYFLAPGKILKITANTGAKIYGPYTTIPSGLDASTVSELYKFYTVKDVREIMDKLTGMVK
ncbi:MAG: hypothetical protein ABUT20_29885 [Bacteroidota bacterium]